MPLRWHTTIRAKWIYIDKKQELRWTAERQCTGTSRAGKAGRVLLGPSDVDSRFLLRQRQAAPPRVAPKERECRGC